MQGLARRKARRAVSQLAWFVGLWLVSVTLLGLVAFAVRMLLRS
jgi:hypothetical protein